MEVRAIRVKEPFIDTAKSRAVLADMYQMAGRAQKEIATYPTQLPTPYRRTGNLGRQWRWSEIRGSEQGVRLQNSAAYAAWVQGRRTQTRVMRARNWPVVEKVWEREARALIKKWAKQLGG